MVAPKTEGNNNLVASNFLALKITKYPHFCPHNGVIFKKSTYFFYRLPHVNPGLESPGHLGYL